MKIGIIGHGVVGGATATVLGRKHEVRAYDRKPGTWTEPRLIAQEAEIVFFCLPTPMMRSGQVDLSVLTGEVDRLAGFVLEDRGYPARAPVFVVRSTAVSGTTRGFAERHPEIRFAFNPEFLTDRNAVEDFAKSDRIIIGTDNKVAETALRRLYTEAGFSCPIHVTTFEAAEMVKYATNCFLATKVTFANELYRICEAVGIPYDEVKSLFSVDARVGPSHLDVPGPDGDFGMGGKCFPKDLNALIHLAQESGHSPSLLREVWRSNLQWRTKRDW